MATSINILFNIRNCDSFIFEDESVISEKSSKVLTITLPDTNVLSFQESEGTFPTFSNDLGYLGYDSHEILGDLDEWGFTSKGDKITANLTSLKEDIEDNPQMFQNSDGENIPFTYSKFPSGVYKINYNFTNIATLGGKLYAGELYYRYDTTANSCLKKKIQKLFAFDLEDEDTKYEYDKLKDEIMKLIMMIHISQFDFNANSYEESNLSLVACDNLCATGDLGYNYDTARQ